MHITVINLAKSSIKAHPEIMKEMKDEINLLFHRVLGFLKKCLNRKLNNEQLALCCIEFVLVILGSGVFMPKAATRIGPDPFLAYSTYFLE